LNKIYRQKKENQQKMLEKIRWGNVDTETLNYLNSKVIPLANFHRENNNYIYLSTTNKKVDSLNEAYLKGFKTDSRKYHALIKGKVNIKDFDPIPEEIEIKVGMQVMCFKNCYPNTPASHAEGADTNYRNGTIGTVVGFDDNFGNVLIEVEQEGEIVIKTVVKSETSKYAYVRVENHIDPKVIGSITQLDCKPCKAITVHKSQGSTFDRIYFDNSFIFGEALTYVALSRLRDLDGLGLSRAITFKDIRANQEAKDFLNLIQRG
jgi:ATP-dependent exoDNAse (exonuclease V) alpha subunit